MRDIKLMIIALTTIVILQHYVVEMKIDEVKQEITELRKVYSND
jgi:hypothetical protein